MPKRLLMFSLLAAVAACNTSTPLAPSGQGSAAHPEFGTSNGPANPGHSFVFRSNDGIFLTSVDEANDLVVRHYNTEDIDFCGGGTAEPTAEAQLVLTPGGAIYTWKTGVLPVYVYRLSEVPPQDVSDQLCIDLKTKWIYREPTSSPTTTTICSLSQVEPTRLAGMRREPYSIVLESSTRIGNRHSASSCQIRFGNLTPLRTRDQVVERGSSRTRCRQGSGACPLLWRQTRPYRSRLMPNGQYDFFFLVQTSQVPMFQLLGTPPVHKRQVIGQGGHFVPRTQLISETLSWLVGTLAGPAPPRTLPNKTLTDCPEKQLPDTALDRGVMLVHLSISTASRRPAKASAEKNRLRNADAEPRAGAPASASGLGTRKAKMPMTRQLTSGGCRVASQIPGERGSAF